MDNTENNLEHVDRLKRDIEEWNQWRFDHAHIQVSLRDIDLRHADLSDANLSYTDLSDANLSYADLSGAKLSYTHLTGAKLKTAALLSADLTQTDLRNADFFNANLSAANLDAANLSDANFRDANLSGANLSDANLSYTNLSSANLSDANLSAANLSGANLSDANLSYTSLSGATLWEANLRDGDLRDANLCAANFSSANLSRADLSGADLSGTNLSDADLSGADLSGADLSGADLSYVKLSYTDLSGANLTKVQFGSTIFAWVDLSNVKGLDTVIHRGPSSVDMNSIVLPSEEHTRQHFLRGVGFSDAFIEYLPSKLTLPIQYYSLFIGYSRFDEYIAKRLYIDLQDNGVRCWFASYDLKPGNYMRKEIDQAIHLQDKLLLILSENAVNSEWVSHEVEVAIAREIHQKREILFPIRLDNEVLQSTSHWATMLKDTRHIGDFTNWTDPQIYQQTFDRLLRDLKKADAS